MSRPDKQKESIQYITFSVTAIQLSVNCGQFNSNSKT